MAAAGGKEKKGNMVMLRSRDGVEFVVPELEASQSLIIQDKLMYDSANYIIPSDGDRTKYEPIRLAVQRNTLSKLIHYCENHASRHDPNWDAEFVTDVDHETLYDLILASHHLQIRELIGLVCHTICSKIKEKSPYEICNIFNIKSVFAPESEKETISQWLQNSYSRPNLVGVPVVPSEKPCLTKLELEEKALQALHIVRCQDFTEYDPKLNGFVCNRFNMYNVALFNHDEESNFCRGPPLHMIPSPTMRDSIVRSCINVISLKVRESDVGFPINVFGTVVARDGVDYRCVYLFRRERDDPQLISSPDDMLSLIDPCRALVPADEVYFEFDLKIKCDGGATKFFSKGVVVFNWVCVPTGKETMTICRNSWLSRMELLCGHVFRPVEATISINILKGPCNLSKVAASTPGNFKNHIILYEAAGTQIVHGEGGSVPLTRNVLAVSQDQKLVLFFVGGDVFEHLVLTLGHSDEVVYRKIGSAELEVKVSWTAVLRRERSDMFKIVGNQLLLL